MDCSRLSAPDSAAEVDNESEDNASLDDPEENRDSSENNTRLSARKRTPTEKYSGNFVKPPRKKAKSNKPIPVAIASVVVETQAVAIPTSNKMQRPSRTEANRGNRPVLIHRSPGPQIQPAVDTGASSQAAVEISAHAKSKKRPRSNLPEPVADADSNGKIEAIIYSFI